jgi:hypothetical protein
MIKSYGVSASTCAAPSRRSETEGRVKKGTMTAIDRVLPVESRRAARFGA